MPWHLLPWFVVFVIFVQRTATEIPFGGINDIIGTPVIECNEDSVSFSIQTTNSFRGNIYVRGQYSVPNCRQGFFNNDLNAATLSVKIGDCGMARVRQLDPHGVNYVLVMVANFHPQFVTKMDRAYSVRCFYAQAEKSVRSEVEVDTPDPEVLEQTTMMMPQCMYSVRVGSLDGQKATMVSVGETLFHRWECNNPAYGMLVKNCVVTDGGAFSSEVLDSRGCPLYSSLIQGDLTYDSRANLAYVEVAAYKFPDKSKLYFQCQIQVCNKRENECAGVTPPNCPTVTRSEFIPNSIVNPNAHPTQVIATFEDTPHSTVTATVRARQPASPTSVPFIPALESSRKLAPNEPFNHLTKFSDTIGQVLPTTFLTGGGPQRRPTAPLQLTSSERLEALQSYNSPLFRKRDSPTPHEPTGDEGLRPILQYGSASGKTSSPWKEPVILKRSNKGHSGPLSERVIARMRRDEEETLDVITEPIFVADVTDIDEQMPPVVRPRKIFTDEDSSISETKYCLHRRVIIAAVVGLGLVAVLCVFIVLYLIYSAIFNRTRSRTGLINPAFEAPGTRATAGRYSPRSSTLRLS